MANLRNIHAICPPEVFEFIMGLFKYNDNSRNKVCRQYDKIFESASNEINLIWMVIVWCHVLLHDDQTIVNFLPVRNNMESQWMQFLTYYDF